MTGVARAVAAAIAGAAETASATSPDVRGADWQTGTVTALGAGTVDVGSIRARRLESYTNAQVGDQVIISQSGMGNWVALGRTASASAALGLPLLPKYKAANTDRNSTTTRTADPDLTMTLDANAVYVVEFHLFIGGPASGLMVTSWIVPSGATGLRGAHGASSTAAGVDTLTNAGDNVPGRFGSHGFATAVTYGRRDTNTNLLYALETGTVITTSAGACAISWAQSASNATATRMGLGSWMRATRIA